MGDSRETKRRKTLLACEYCRNKKTKCDGERPVCGACARKGWGPEQCLWKHVDGREDTVPIGLVRDLERRIQELERQGAGQPSNSLALTTSASTPLLPVHSPSGIGPSPNSITAMEGAVTGEPQDEGYLGPGAAAAFMDTVRRAVDPKSASRPAAAQRTTAAGLGHVQVPSMMNMLPSKQEGEVLMQSYWSFVHPIYPFLYRPRFDAIHASLWSGTPVPIAAQPIMQTSPQDNLCMVLLVLSLGCQYAIETDFDHQNRYGSQQAETYFRRARTTFQYDPLDDRPPTLQRAQILLLMAQYLKSIGSTHKAWDIIGYAVRMCQRQGLHLPTTSSMDAMPSFADREMVKRVWHGCVMTERMVSATLGRPAMISIADTSQLSLPLEVDEGLFQLGRLDKDGTEEMVLSTESTISFFVHSVELFEIFQRILVAMYSDSKGESNEDHLRHLAGPDSIFALDGQLIKWRKQLPPYLKLRAKVESRIARTSGHSFARQAVVLKNRYLQIRIYLFRPLLSHVCTTQHRPALGASDIDDETDSATNLWQRVAIQCSLICIREAIDLIETAHANHTTAEAWGQKPSWLYGVLHVYLAATVLLAARLAPATLLTEVSDDDIQKAWKQALEILRDFQADSVSAQRCVAALEVLYRKLPGGVSGPSEVINGNLGNDSDTMDVQGSTSIHLDFAAPTSFASGNSLTSSGDQLDFTWEPDFDLSDPYNMSWFMWPDSIT